VTPIGPLHRGPGEINYPVSVGSIVVHPGDVVVADLNGVVVVPSDTVTEIIQRLQRREATEADYTEAVSRGDFNNDWVDRTLEDSGVIVTRSEPV
jgi:regulator of RNase E activity RraA